MTKLVMARKKISEVRFWRIFLMTRLIMVGYVLRVCLSAQVTKKIQNLMTISLTRDSGKTPFLWTNGPVIMFFIAPQTW